jgi:hypothetical protein
MEFPQDRLGMDKSLLKLVYVRPVTNSRDNMNYEYDFLFSETPEIVWGVDWTDNAPNLCGDISPEKTTYSVVKRVKCPIELKVIQENTCYSMEYAINRSVALAWLNLDGLEEYPQNGRLVFKFGDSYFEVEAQLGLHELEFSN